MNLKKKLKIKKKEIDIFQAYFENNNTGNIIWNVKKDSIVYFNSYFYELLGLEKNKITNSFAKNFFDFENNLEIKKIISGKINNLGYEKKYTLNEKESLWFFINVSLYEDNLLFRVSDITKPKKEQAHLDSLIESLDNFIWSMDKDYNLISFNNHFYDHIFNNFGISISIGFNMESFLEKNSFWLDLYQKAFTGESIIVERQVNSTFFKANINPIFINNEVIGVSISSKDITRINQKEIELEETNQKFKNAFEFSPIGIAIVALDGKFLKTNNAVSYITGYSEEELLNITFQDITHPDDLEADLSYLNEVISGIRNNYNLEKRYIHKDGHIVYALLSVSVVKDNNNNPLYFLSQIKDITIQKINEEQIRLNQSKLLALIENTQDFIWSVDLENRIISYNSHFKKFILDTFKVYLKEGLSIPNVLNEQELYIWNTMYYKSLNGKFLSREIQWNSKYYSLSLNPIRDGEIIIGVSVFARDITSKKLTEIELLESEEKFRGAFDNSPIGMRIADLNGKTIKINQSFCNIIGYSSKELENITHKDISYPDELENESRYVSLLKNSEIDKYQMEKRLIHKTGKTIWISLSVSAIKNSKNKIIYTIAQVEDITSKKESQLEILSKNIELEKKNEELEQFAYLVSHDLQAPLNSIKAYISMLDNKDIFSSEEENIDEYVHTNIVNSCNKMKSFISDLLLYSKAGKKLPLENIDTNIVLDSAINNLKCLIEQINAKIEYDYLPDISANSLKTEQLFQNLIDNALKYRKENVQPIINIKCLSDGDFWKFSIQDNGIGIDLKYQDAVFKTFRRLHSNDKYSGNGIGLSICKKIVEQYGGEIWFESTLGEGTTFYFTIQK